MESRDAIIIRLDTIDQLVEPCPPSPFRKRRLREEAKKFLVERLTALRHPKVSNEWPQSLPPSWRLNRLTFRYKKEIDTDGTKQFGLVAEEVEKVNPDPVTRDEEGKPETVRYEAVNAMLLNEFLKAHQKIKEQEHTIAQLKSAMDALSASVRKQAAQIQKVSAQLEVNKTAPQIVLHNQ